MSREKMPIDELEGYKHQLLNKVVSLWRIRGLTIEAVTGRLQNLSYNPLLPKAGLVARINSEDYYDIILPDDISALIKQPDKTKLEEIAEEMQWRNICY